MPPYLRLMDSEPWRKHWNSFFMDSSLIPMPVSRMLTRTSCFHVLPPLHVSSSVASLQAAWMTTSPEGVNLTAFARMLASTWVRHQNCSKGSRVVVGSERSDDAHQNR